MNALKALQQHGQAVWLDFLSRGFIAKGGLKKLVDEDGRTRGHVEPVDLRTGHRLIPDEYDGADRAACCRSTTAPPANLFERLAVEDIQSATDVLRPVFDATGGADGFVSLEVSPYLAMDTEGHASPKRERLWHAVGRHNLMIKVPGTAGRLAGHPRN